jgi:outer membrane receptor for ferrienterochelin and colicin
MKILKAPMLKCIGLLLLWAISTFDKTTLAQEMVQGIVLQSDEKGNYSPIEGAIVAWLGSNINTQSDSNGYFKIKYPLSPIDGFKNPMLFVGYMGLVGDTIEIDSVSSSLLRILLKEENSTILKEVEVNARIQSTYIDPLAIENTSKITEKELFKAACCNLSESFETNPSVEVSYTDAVTGAKQIQMLGLSGIYSQLMSENIPFSRGLSSSMGLSFIPGSWIESIQLTKGVGSVVNGFESIAGLINVEQKKPSLGTKNQERLFYNSYFNEQGRFENNLNLSSRLSKTWSTSVLLHNNYQLNNINQNKDNFLDIPMGKQWNIHNRYKFEHQKWLIQFGWKALVDKREGGQYQSSNASPLYSININTSRAEFFAKAGYTFEAKKYKSLGIISNFSYQNQANIYGLRAYNAFQRSWYLNLIYQSIILNTNHKFRTGMSNQSDLLNEKVILSNPMGYHRIESTTGIYVEYTNTSLKKFTFIAGLRFDYNNLFGWIITPRVHTKWELPNNHVIRTVVGTGQRTANLFAENTSIFASSRNFHIIHDAQHHSKAYGLKPERAINYGIGWNKEMKIFYKNAGISVDIYRTEFFNQSVVDFESAREIKFYDLKGQSFSNSLIAEFRLEPIRRFDVKLAYRYLDAQTSYENNLLLRPLTNNHRFFANLEYSTRSKWRFDLTLTWNSKKRIPSTIENPALYRSYSFSPDYWFINCQVAKSFGNQKTYWWDAYVGIENIGNFRQQDLIIAWQEPFSDYFDSSLIWGPIFGRMIYAGLRFKIH